MSSTSFAVAATASPEPGGDPAVTADDEDAPTITKDTKEVVEPKGAKPDDNKKAEPKAHKADAKSAKSGGSEHAKPVMAKPHPPTIKPPAKPKPVAKAKAKAKKPAKPKKQAKAKPGKTKTASHKPATPKKKHHHGAAKGPTHPASTLEPN